ncbi:hypothetical protein [Mesorhizobium sp. B2-3-15]|uniref:hypothetical protein n=1 Tax=Mesorhizobium sp. B2-3-15 TaxID=2589949 RepID=UPI0011295B31|nr:hypothetical protein [Mesorhizobium sp. B2-3-15]TPL64111.1 hypothetical protein FJ954_29825 [Mesorhizobium sp. B2-3-15]
MTLPATIVLKAGPTQKSADLCAAFGFTRQSLNYYRRHRDFPQPSGRNSAARYDTRSVSQWIAANGCKTVFV